MYVIWTHPWHHYCLSWLACTCPSWPAAPNPTRPEARSFDLIYSMVVHDSIVVVTTSMTVLFKAPWKFVPRVYHKVMKMPEEISIYITVSKNEDVYNSYKIHIFLRYFFGHVPLEAMIRAWVKVREPHGWHCLNTQTLNKSFFFPSLRNHRVLQLLLTGLGL